MRTEEEKIEIIRRNAKVVIKMLEHYDHLLYKWHSYECDSIEELAEIPEKESEDPTHIIELSDGTKVGVTENYLKKMLVIR